MENLNPSIFYIKKDAYIAAKIPCRNFPIKYGFIGIFDFDVILKTCKSTEKPPNPRTKEQRINLNFILSDARLHINEIPFVTSMKPVIILAENPFGIPKNSLRKLEIIYIIWLEFKMEIIIEKSTTNPPIISIVLIEDKMLFCRISPKLSKFNVLFSLDKVVFLLDFS